VSTPPAADAAVLTLATGKPVYVAMAEYLARSFLWWHPRSSIRFALATDLPECVPADVRARVTVIPLQPKQFGEGFSPKLHLDRIAPAQRTLFIDADCLLVGALEPLFERLRGRSVAVVGGSIASGHWFGDVTSLCQRLGVPSLPKFNGGLYYLERDAVAEQVYAEARRLEAQYDDLGLVRLRGRPNDELLMALAMARHGQTALPDDGTVMSDPQACRGGWKMDVLGGGAWMRNPPPPDPRHQDWYPFTDVTPVIVHFLGGYTEHYPYVREVLRLNLAQRRGWPVAAANAAAWVRCTAPHVAVRWFKDTFRPLYHRWFGPRRVRKSDRE
jgi:hypothetical protein